MLGWISNILGRKNATRTAFGLRLRAKPACRSWVEGRFDAAQSTPDNRRHWANADGLSADSAAKRGPFGTVSGQLALYDL